MFDAARQAFERIRPLVERLAHDAGTDASSLIGQLPGGSQIAGQAVAWLGGFLAGLLNGGVALINLRRWSSSRPWWCSTCCATGPASSPRSNRCCRATRRRPSLH
jgi:hypothetical protein